MPAQLSKFRTENPRRSSVTKGGISVRVEDGTEEGIQFTVPWNDVGQACMRRNQPIVPQQKARNLIDIQTYYQKIGYDSRAPQLDNVAD